MTLKKLLVLGGMFGFFLAMPSVLAWISDANYGYRYTIYSNSTNETFNIISVNDSNIGGGNRTFWAMNSTSGEDLYVYCEVSGCASGAIMIGNDTHTKCFLNETDGTGLCPNDITNTHVLLWLTANNNTGELMDVSGNNRNFTKDNSPALPNAIYYKGARTFENDNYWYQTDAEGSWFEGLSQFSVMFWFYRNVTPIGFDGSIFYKRNTLAIRNPDSSATIDALVYATGSAQPVSENLQIDTWYFIALTYNSTHVRLYVNDTLQDTKALTGGLDASAYWVTLGATCWDAATCLAGSSIMDMSIDNIMFYDVAFEQEQIMDAYHQGEFIHLGYNNYTSLGAEETKPTPAANINLFLNGTQGNVSYLNGSFANFTVSSNVTALANLTTNITGWQDLSSETPYYNYTRIVCANNDTWFNITAFIGNGSWVGENETHYAICYVIPIPTIVETDYCMWLWAEEHGEKLANDNWCISNDTLAHNISYQIYLDGNISTMYMYSTEVCRFGCDNVTNSCAPNPVTLNLYIGGGVLALLIIIGLIIKLLRR